MATQDFTTDSPHDFTTPSGKPEQPGEVSGFEVAWEDPDVHGGLNKLLQTFIQVIFMPNKVFSTMRMRGYRRPFLLHYYTVMTYIVLIALLFFFLGAVVFRFLVMMFPGLTIGPDQLRDLIPIAAGGFQAILGVILSFAFLASLIFFISMPIILFSTIFYHILFALFRSSSGGIQGTFRIMTYCTPAYFLSVVPIIGFAIPYFYYVIAAKNIHRISGWRAAFILGLPLLVVWILVILTSLYLKYKAV